MVDTHCQMLDLYKVPTNNHPGGSFLLRGIWLLVARPLVASNIMEEVYSTFIWI